MRVAAPATLTAQPQTPVPPVVDVRVIRYSLLTATTWEDAQDMIDSVFGNFAYPNKVEVSETPGMVMMLFISIVPQSLPVGSLPGAYYRTTEVRELRGNIKELTTGRTVVYTDSKQD